jgi:HK97 family phage major capsid protein
MKDKLNKKRVEAKKLLDAMRNMHDTADSEKRSFNAEETDKFKRMESDFDALKSEISQLERMIDAERYLGEITTDPVRDFDATSQKRDNKDEEYTREFYAMIRGGEFNPSILRNLEIATDSKGGYTVPTVLLNQVIKALNETSNLRQLGTVITTSSTTNIPTMASKPSFALIAENGAFPTVNTSFGVKTIKAYKVGGTMLASDELLNDSGIDIASYIQGLMVSGIGDFEEDKFVNGSGTNDFQGLKNATVGITSASPTALTSDEILDMHYSVAAKYRPKASWLVSDAFEKAVMKLKDTTGRYIWQMGLAEGKPNTLNGRPVYNSAYLGELAATAVPAVFGDLSYFTIADRGAMTMKRLNELYAGTGQVGFQVSKRGDSRITLDEAIKTLKMHA